MSDHPNSSMPMVEKNLSGYNLPADSLFEIQALLMRRFQARFSEGLSPEGKQAMKQALEEMNSRNDENDKVVIDNSKVKHVRISTVKQEHSSIRKQRESGEEKLKRNTSFTETFEKSSTERLEGDITDTSQSRANVKKMAIGGKIETAMETIEIVKHGEAEKDKQDMSTVNSVEKCLVWMEVNGVETSMD
ncbi:uncharacterized protein LOC128212986 [Mya arenaria]|uniref:uncharacterized protein LOC128212986 n=1 Tax=Mya arenaria TaxID=6604 RepID=UPI0022E157A2|nr:uncharacterized protein LOC128212986 [Mya arenaria]